MLDNTCKIDRRRSISLYGSDSKRKREKCDCDRNRREERGESDKFVIESAENIDPLARFHGGGGSKLGHLHLCTTNFYMHPSPDAFNEIF